MKIDENKNTYRAVNGRCAIHVASFELPISDEEALVLLQEQGFTVITPNISERARFCVEHSQFKRAARFSEAPEVVDCSSFVKWVYGQMGIWLPRRSVQQIQMGSEVSIDDVREGDVIFISGRVNYNLRSEGIGVGHVGIVTDKGTVIHASKKEGRPAELSLKDFLNEKTVEGKTRKLQGVRRYVDDFSELLFVETPEHRDVETSDDVKWILLQNIIY